MQSSVLDKRVRHLDGLMWRMA